MQVVKEKMTAEIFDKIWNLAYLCSLSLLYVILLYGPLTQWGRRLEIWPNTEVSLASWRRVQYMTQPGEICVCDGRSMPPSLMDRTACLVWICSCELLANPAAVVDFLMYTKHRHELNHARKEGIGHNSSWTPAVSLLFTLSPHPLFPTPPPIINSLP
jgi:hypothetical protein